jgi:elongation of very long chain fatty acids protein 6
MSQAELLRYFGEALTTPWESNFVNTTTATFALEYWKIPLSLTAIYAAFCYFGTKVMVNHKAVSCKHALAAWNCLLCVFSFTGMWRTLPRLLSMLLTVPVIDTMCTHPAESWGNGSTGFWVMLFIFSKVPELMDTVFIVLRKRPLIFLHWYHHLTVLLYCWHAYATQSAAGLYFVAMNYTVHAIMYGYFCLQSLGLCPKWFPAHLITGLQIAQMVVGTGVCIMSWYYQLSGKSCHQDMGNLIAGAAIYASYLYLFVEFARRKYSSNKNTLGKNK